MIYIALLWLGAASSLSSSYSHAFNCNYLLLSVFDPFFNCQRDNAGDMGAMLLPKLLISKDIMPFRRIAASLLFLLALLVAPALSNAQEPPSPTPQSSSSVDELIHILENEDARNALLTRLKSEAAAQQVQEPIEEDPTIARQIAEQTRAAAEQIVAGGEAVWSGVAALAVIFTGEARSTMVRSRP